MHLGIQAPGPVPRCQPGDIVIQGAALGADTIGEDWATLRGITFTPYPTTQASWDRLDTVLGTSATHRCPATANPTMFSFCPEARALSIWSSTGDESSGNVRHKTLWALK